MIQLDTHVVLWLYAGDVSRIPPAARDMLEANDLSISPMVVLEAQYLFEVGRTTQPGHAVIQDLKRRIGLQVSATPFVEVINAATELSWTRDPFDRLIAAQALCESTKLLTADASILQNLPLASWR